jgi:Uncharacterised protein family (UPF0104).
MINFYLYLQYGFSIEPCGDKLPAKCYFWPMMNKTVKSVAKNVLKFLVSAAAIWWVMSKISFNEVVNVFSTANVWYLLLALLFVVFSMVLSAFRQNLTFANNRCQSVANAQY